MDLLPFPDLQSISGAEVGLEFQPLLAGKLSAKAAVLYMLSIH